MATYEETMRIIRDSKRYEFDGTELTLTGYYTGKETKLDFAGMTEETFENLADENTDTSYKEAMKILNSSKQYKFDETKLTISDYFTGNTIILDLRNLNEEMYNELKAEENLDEDLDEDFDEDFEDAINNMEDGGLNL